MLNRRLLRIKVLQIVYAHTFSSEKPVFESEKELLFSAGKSHELYLLILELLTDIAHQAKLKAELIENREVTDRSDAIKYNRLADNTLIAAISSNREFKSKIKSSGQTWNDNLTLVKDYMNQIFESSFFNKYIENEEPTFILDKKLALYIISDIIPLNESLFNYIEDKSIYWNDDIDFILEMVYKTVKNITENDANSFEVLSPFSNDDDKEFGVTLLRKCIVDFNKYSEIIEKHLENWQLDRVAEIDLLLIKMAIIEAVEFNSIPMKVTLNEYIEIAKYYSTENSGTFINGLIDRIYKQLVTEKVIVKTGRGLID
jgi:transcription antitermination protein NusB